MKRLVCLFIVVVSMLPLLAFAHSGRTDANGGHYDRSTGEYHYHHGYSAHQHTNGKCPYDYKDKTGENSGTSVSSKTTTKTTTVTPTKTSKGIPATWVAVFVVGIVSIVAWNVRRENLYRKEQQIKATEEAERRKQVDFYQANDLRTLSGMPDIYFIGEHGMPEEFAKGDEFVYGKTLDVYVSSETSGGCYHRKGCRFARFVTNLYDPQHEYYRRRPCSVCNPGALPDRTWLAEYKRHEKMCAELGVEPIVRNP